MIEKFNYISSNVEESKRLGCLFSSFLSRGDVVGFNGDLGSGKTTFIKGVLNGLNYKGDVTSPTFSLVNEYEADFKVIHIDFYRESNVNRWKNIGFEEIIYTNDIVLIEWSDLIPDILPSHIKILLFEHMSLNKRKINLK